jgi:hypothetical protein
MIVFTRPRSLSPSEWKLPSLPHPFPPSRLLSSSFSLPGHFWDSMNLTEHSQTTRMCLFSRAQCPIKPRWPPRFCSLVDVALADWMSSASGTWTASAALEVELLFGDTRPLLHPALQLKWTRKSLDAETSSSLPSGVLVVNLLPLVLRPRRLDYLPKTCHQALRDLDQYPV